MSALNYHSGNNNRFPFFDYISYTAALLLAVAILYLMSGCNMEKYCANHYPPTVEHRDSIAYVEIETLRDTTIYLPGETFTIIDSIPCDETNKAQLSLKEVKTSRGKLSIEVKDGKLKADCKTDSLQALITARDRTISKLKEEKSVEVKTVFKKTGFDRFCNIFFYIVCALLVGYIAGKYFKLL